MKLSVIALWSVATVALAGCGSFLPEENLKAVPASELQQIQFFTPATASMQPKIAKVLGPVEGHSCKSALWDPPASESAALDQLRARARTLGANGLVDVKYDRAGTSFGTNCWQSVSASATAVIFEPR